MAIHKVAGEVDAFCTRCKLSLAHIIVAMIGSKIARARCNTCGGEHAYRTEPGARARAPSAPRSPRAKVVVSFADRLAHANPATAVPYSPKQVYTVEQLINHPSFGLGLVTAVRQDKLDVAFKAAQKTLVHRQSAVPAARPVFHPPASSPASDQPGDKPPPLAFGHNKFQQ